MDDYWEKALFEKDALEKVTGTARYTNDYSV